MHDQPVVPGPSSADADESSHATLEPEQPRSRPARSPLRGVLAIAIVLTGLVWMLQGLGILTAGRSFMIGDPTWAVIGVAFVVLGIGLGIRARRRTA